MFICQFLWFFPLPSFTSKETVVKLKSFADHFSSYTHFLQKILPYQLKRSVACVRNRTVGWLRLYWRPLCLFLQLGGRMRGPSVHGCPHCQKPGAAERHQKNDFYIWEAAELHCRFSLTQWVRTGQEDTQNSRILKTPNAMKNSVNWRNTFFLSGVCQDALPQSSTSAVFTQLAACLHSLHDAIKGKCSFETRTEQTECSDFALVKAEAQLSVNSMQSYFCNSSVKVTLKNLRKGN